MCVHKLLCVWKRSRTALACVMALCSSSVMAISSLYLYFFPFDEDKLYHPRDIFHFCCLPLKKIHRNYSFCQNTVKSAITVIKTRNLWQKIYILRGSHIRPNLWCFCSSKYNCCNLIFCRNFGKMLKKGWFFNQPYWNSIIFLCTYYELKKAAGFFKHDCCMLPLNICFKTDQRFNISKHV